MIKTLIVDDSAIIRNILTRVMQDDGRFEIVGQAENGEKAVRKNDELKPDLIIMDYNMPVMNGLLASKRIFENSEHLPAIVTFTTETDIAIKEEFFAAGILAFFQKPNIASMTKEQLNVFCDSLEEVYNKRTMKVFPSGNYFSKISQVSLPAKEKIEKQPITDSLSGFHYKLLVIGSSTGGPEALKQVLSDIGPNFPLPILVTQHIDALFDRQLVSWLSSVTGLSVELAKDNTIPKKGCVYLAPAEKHLKIGSHNSDSETFNIMLSDEPPVHFLKPAVDIMFRSVRESFGGEVIAVILTGMGADGSEELLRLKKAGAYTICQDEKSSVVYGMPKAAAELGGATEILPLNQIGKKLRGLVF